jgi:hypothetical protein
MENLTENADFMGEVYEVGRVSAAVDRIVAAVVAVGVEGLNQ